MSIISNYILRALPTPDTELRAELLEAQRLASVLLQELAFTSAALHMRQYAFSFTRARPGDHWHLQSVIQKDPSNNIPQLFVLSFCVVDSICFHPCLIDALQIGTILPVGDHNPNLNECRCIVLLS